MLVHVDDLNGPEPLRDMDRLFSRADARVSSIIEPGAAECLCCVNVKVPRIVDKDGEVIRPAHQQYLPIEGPLDSDLLGVVRNQLRPPQVAPAAPTGAQQTGSSGTRSTTGPIRGSAHDHADASAGAAQ